MLHSKHDAVFSMFYRIYVGSNGSMVSNNVQRTSENNTYKNDDDI